MDFINSLIFENLENGTYNALAGTLGQVFLWLLTLWYIWRMRLPALKAIPLAYIGFWFTTNWNGVVLAASTGFENVTRVNLAVAFVYLLPLAWLMAKLFRMPMPAVSEMWAIGIMAFHTFGRSGCIFTGCCYGYPCSWGIYSQLVDDYVFPIVFVESLMSLAILVFMLVRVCRKDYHPDGKTMPWMLLLYGVGRFFTEFWRDDNDKIWMNVSDIACHALFMAVVGGGVLWYLSRKQPQRETIPAQN